MELVEKVNGGVQWEINGVGMVIFVGEFEEAEYSDDAEHPG